jgi:hypothetical protein
MPGRLSLRPLVQTDADKRRAIEETLIHGEARA